jgi:hypothetical protein
MIATRMLKIKDGCETRDLPVRIFAPESDDRAWSCRYEIDWPEGLQVMNASGIDSVQALVLALYMIGAELYSSSYHKSGRLMFDEPGQGYGFPVPNSLRDLLIGNDRKYGA